MLIVCCYFSLRAEGPKENSATSCATKRNAVIGALPRPPPPFEEKERTSYAEPKLSYGAAVELVLNV